MVEEQASQGMGDRIDLLDLDGLNVGVDRGLRPHSVMLGSTVIATKMNTVAGVWATAVGMLNTVLSTSTT